uniref:AlNc14C41G3489 protein n=1 Tax=Albugo laibachii Nc14 TaxID=890382 RepID=F0W9N4_9STRA|nr:AlNc14C41G3489 [Albugo laibachii Nc14]|eukprot:CCA17852.1 AlNc14C41G3489 [Albugo laibachii Nc14]
MAQWITTNTSRQRLLHQNLAAFPSFFTLRVRSSESKAQMSDLRYLVPALVKYFQPQRFVTVTLHLSDKVKMRTPPNLNARMINWSSDLFADLFP